MPAPNIFELRQRFRKSVEYLWRNWIFAATVYMLKVAKFQMLSMHKVFTLPLQTLNTCALETFHPNAHPQHLRFEAKIFETRLSCFGDIGFCWHIVQVECGKISNVVEAPSLHLAIAKVKYLHTWNFPPKCPPSTSSSWGKDFENRLNTFGDIGFLVAHSTGWKWQNFKCCWCGKFSPCNCKSKIPVHLIISTQVPTVNIFELRKRFRKSVEYLWRYRIFSGTVYRLKVAKFQMFSSTKFSHCNCKRKVPAHLKLSTQMLALNIFELRQRFRKSVKYLWKDWIFASPVYRLKVAVFQILSMRKVFTLPLQK